MNGDPNYYYLAALPGMRDLGSAPPIGPKQLLERVAPLPTTRRIIETLYLLDDLVQREAYAADELSSVHPVVLTVAQVRNEAALPACLSGGSRRTFPADTVWGTYFRYAAGVAQESSCRFLVDWVGFEVGLRNALASARANHRGLHTGHYWVAAELGEPSELLTAIVSERANAPTPLAELKTLIHARWEWATEHEAWFSFTDDEFAAYACKLRLLIQYERLVKTGQQHPQTHNDVGRVARLEEVSP